MSDDFHIAQLRHAYQCLVNDWVRPENFRQFADGLIAPTIRYLEERDKRERSERIAADMRKRNGWVDPEGVGQYRG